MISIDCTHPDLIDFIKIKTDLNKVNKANISIKITDEFMEAIQNDKEWLMSFYVVDTGEMVAKKEKARDIYNLICECNWNYAEPGFIFWSKINNWSLLSGDDNFEYAGLNPCAEEPLPAYGSCNLVSINLSEFVINPFTDNAQFNFVEFNNVVKELVIYMNNILDESIQNNLYPLQQQKQMVEDWRQIGIGIMGLADMLIKMKIKYGNKQSIELADKIGFEMINTSLQQSALLAKEKGTYPKYNKQAILKSEFLNYNAYSETIEMIDKYGLRNSQLLTIAPTGSISTMLGVSGGIEPIFMNSYTRKTESLHSEDVYYKVYTPIVKDYMDLYNIKEEKNLPNFFVTAMNLDYRDRIKMQSVWQSHIDASISSTINLPNSATIEDVKDLYMSAWQSGLKGITIYRDGCTRSGILINDNKDRKEEIEKLQNNLSNLLLEEFKDNPNICPMCGGEMFYSGGCSECRDCGYSPCSI